MDLAASQMSLNPNERIQNPNAKAAIKKTAFATF
jgi:hypothetical protein